VSKGTKCDRRIANVGFVREHNLQNGDVSDDRRRDGGDEEEDGRQEDEDHADPIPANEVSCACATNEPNGGRTNGTCEP
jgi:hypothetical protein